MAKFMARRRGLSPGVQIQETACTPTQEKVRGPGYSYCAEYMWEGDLGLDAGYNGNHG